MSHQLDRSLGLGILVTVFAARVRPNAAHATPGPIIGRRDVHYG